MKLKSFFARAGKGLVFFLIAALLFQLIGLVLIPKWSGYWKSSDTITGFYQLEEDSIDTLILGSSQVISGVTSMELYQNYGISAYSLGTERQPALCSYYLLQEALRTQPNLKAVIFEVTELFNVCDEASYRKGLDYLPFSAGKWDAIQTHITWAKQREKEEGGEPAPTALSYLVPVFTYHDRWNELTKDDFTYYLNDRTDPYRGFSIQTNQGAKGDYQPLDVNASAACAEPDPEALDCFRKMCALCQVHDIQLILLKTPRLDWTLDEYNSTCVLANQYQLPFLDFSTPELQEAIGYDFTIDNLYRSSTHLNLSGAQKVTNYLGAYLKEHCQVRDVRGTSAAEALEAELPQYLEGIEDGNLYLKPDLVNYLQACQRERYSVLLAVNAKGNCAFSEENQAALEALGFDTRFCNGGGNYLALLENGTIPLQLWGAEPLAQSITLADSTYVSLLSSSNSCSISIGGTEATLNRAGLNIVVYNHKTGLVVDSVAFTMDEKVINKDTNAVELALVSTR